MVGCGGSVHFRPISIRDDAAKVVAGLRGRGAVTAAATSYRLADLAPAAARSIAAKTMVDRCVRAARVALLVAALLRAAAQPVPEEDEPSDGYPASSSRPSSSAYHDDRHGR